MENSTVSYPAIHFDEPEDEHEIIIPVGYAAIRIAPDSLPARIDLAPGTHRLNGVAFDDIDVPFSIAVMPEHLAKLAARSKAKTEVYQP